MHNVCELFLATGEVAAKERESQRVLDEYHELLIVRLILNQPDMYLRVLCRHVHIVTRVQVSESTMCRVLSKNGLTRKKIGQVAAQRCSDLRGRFMAEMSCFSTSQLVWVDETGCKKKDSI